MRELLERLELLTEKTFNIDRDVDFLYKQGDLGKFDRLLAGDSSPDKIGEVLKDAKPGVTFWKGTSADLKSRASKQGHKVNPVKIKIGVYVDGSWYKPVMGKMKQAELQISIAASAVNVLRDAYFQLNAVKGRLGDGQYSWLEREFDAENLKGTIAHEISHWLNDSLHNQNITKSLRVAREHGDHAIKGDYASVNQTPMEFDAQIHAIKYIKKQVGAKAFNKMTWDELLHHKGSLISQFSSAYGQMLMYDNYEEAMKRFAKRLHREGLLGKALRKLPTATQMYTIIKRRSGR